MSLSPPFPPSDFVSLECFRMKLRKECGEAMHSIAMVTIRLQSCLILEHRIRVLCVYTRVLVLHVLVFVE